MPPRAAATDTKQENLRWEAAVVFWTISEEETRNDVDPIGALVRFFALVRWYLAEPVVRLSHGVGRLHHE